MLSLKDVFTINSPFSSVVVVAMMFCLGARIQIGPFLNVTSKETFDTSADSLPLFHIVGEVH